MAAVDPAAMIVIAFLVATSGPIVGCLLQRLWGGSGIKGAVVGGVLWRCAAVIITYIRAYWSPAPGTFDALGPAIAIPLTTAWGSGIGLLTSLTLRTLLGPPAPWRARRPAPVPPPHSPAPAPQGR